MKRLSIVAALAFTGTVSMSAVAGPAVGVNVGIGNPGYYGQIDVGAATAPQLIYPSPTEVQAATPGVTVAPMYLHVPVEHYHNWRNYCGYYHACARPVYFVNDNWYHHTYVPNYHRVLPRYDFRVVEHRNLHFDTNGRRYIR